MARVTAPMTTTIGCHKIPEQIALAGKAMGLTVTHDVAGGWFEKSHFITAVGDEATARRFYQIIRRYERATS